MRAFTTVACAALLGCNGSNSPEATSPGEESVEHSDAANPSGNRNSAMQLQSAAISKDGSIDSKYTCEGEDVSVPLSWGDLPEGTKSLALIIDDPDAPDPKNPKRTWVHWVLYNIPPEVTQLPEGAADDLPEGVQTGKNDWGKTTYGGPCPPIGRHRYFHKLYALDTQLDLQRPTKAELEQAMNGHILAQTELVGTYEKEG